MNKGLVALVAGAALLAGCASGPKRGLQTETDYKRDAVTLQTPGLESGAELRRSTGQDYRYDLEEVVIHGERYFVEPNHYGSENEANFALTRFRDHKLRIAGDRLEVVSEDVYVPVKLIDPATGTEVTRGEFNVFGRYGTRANRTEFETGGVQSGIVRTNNRDLKFDIRTISIAGKEYFLPYAEVADEGQLDFVIFPHQGTNLEFDPFGKISFENEGGIYRPMRMSRAQFESRGPGVRSSPGNNLGEITFEAAIGVGTEALLEDN